MTTYKTFSTSTRAFLQDKRAIVVVLLLVLLPFLVASLYFVQQFQSKAATEAVVTDLKATRTSNVAATITFATDKAVKLTVQCSLDMNGVKFFCGQDSLPLLKHLIKTDEADVILNPNTPYYVFVTAGGETYRTFIAATPDEVPFGITTFSFSEDKVGYCDGEAGFDASLDINKDGCVNMADYGEVLTD